MKKYIALFLCLVMLLLSACGAEPANGADPTNGTENTTNTTAGTSDSTGENNSTDTVPTTESAESTQAATTETTKPTDGSAVSEEYTLKITTQNNLPLEVGQVGNLQFEYTGTGTLVWSSNDENVATVSNGKVTAKSVGNATITVTDGAKTTGITVIVSKAAEKPVDVKLNVSIDNNNLTVGEVATLSVSYNGSKQLTISSNNTAVASVSGYKVTAKKAGNAVITVSDGVNMATCSITVVNKTTPTVVSISVKPTTLNLVVGNTSTLTYEYNGTGTLTWSSNKTSVATVANGKVTAKAAGTAIITLSDGPNSATCTVTVTAPEPEPAPTTPAVKLEIKTAQYSTVFVGETLKIDYVYTGSNTLSWMSGDTNYLTVNNNGLVTGKAVGSTVVIVSDGTLMQTVSIKVVAPANKTNDFDFKNQNAPLSNGCTKYAGDSMEFRVTAIPYDSNPNTVVTSTDTSVVSVSYNLRSNKDTQVTLNFKKAGSATIKITSGDGAYAESYKITVKSDYDCNPGSGQLTPEQYVAAYNGVSKALGMSTSSKPTGYLVYTYSAQGLTWKTARRNSEGCFHEWWRIGYRTMVLTYEGQDENGNYIFYVRGS